MKMIYYIICLFVVLLTASCTPDPLFTEYTKEVFNLTKVTESDVRTIKILNESNEEIQHIVSMAFHAESNKNGHFQIQGVDVGTSRVGLKDLYIPPMGILKLNISYAPLNLETSEESFGGWITKEDDKGIVEVSDNGDIIVRSSLLESSTDIMSALGGEVEDQTLLGYEPAIHRAMLIIGYDRPREGYIYIELIGSAIPSPDGEISAIAPGSAVGGSDCMAEGTTACFRGTFSIDLPGLMSGGALEVPMTPFPITIDGSSAEINMNEFPPVLIALVGNGPGEPLEGQALDALSIVISGMEDSISQGSFDGRNLEMSDVTFRVRIALGELQPEDINQGLNAAVDFNIPDLEITTEEPFDGSRIIFGTEATLSDNPSGNSLFDSALGGARIIVKFTGQLELP